MIRTMEPEAWIMPKKTVFVNLFGGPGLGKSTTAAGVFHMLKMHGVDAELVTEFPKDLTWENRDYTLGNQVYVFGKQHHRHWRLDGRVDVVVTDSPILLSMVYSDDERLHKMALHEFARMGTTHINYLLRRFKKYNPNGRNQTLAQAREKDAQIQACLETNSVPFSTVRGDHDAVNKIVRAVLGRSSRKLRYQITRRT